MFDSSVYFDIVRLWSLESQPAGLSLASYSSVIIHWKKWFCINNSVTCTWTVQWVILTDRCCAQRFQKYRRYLPYPCSRLFFLFSRSQCFSHRFFHLFFLTVCVQNQLQCFSWGPPEAEGHVRIHVSALHPGVILPVSQKCDGAACVQLLVSSNPFAGGFPWSPLAVLSTLCPQAAPSSGWSLGLCTWSCLNQTPCFFQAISLIVEIILNSVLDCRVLAIPCSFSLHQ